MANTGLKSAYVRPMAYGESNGHVSDQSRHEILKGQVVTPILVKPNISNTAGDAI